MCSPLPTLPLLHDTFVVSQRRKLQVFDLGQESWATLKEVGHCGEGVSFLLKNPLDFVRGHLLTPLTVGSVFDFVSAANER